MPGKYQSLHQLCLLKSPFLLRQLMLPAAMATILGHDVGAALAPPDPANVGAFAPRSSSKCWHYGTSCRCCTAPGECVSRRPTGGSGFCSPASGPDGERHS